MATAGIGIASVIHQEIINAATANTRFADTSTRKGLKKRIKINNKGPIKNETAGPNCECFSAFTYIIFNEDILFLKNLKLLEHVNMDFKSLYLCILPLTKNKCLLKEIIIAVQSYFKAHDFIKEHKLWRWIFIPGILYAILFGVSIYFFGKSATAVISYLTIDTGLQSWLDKLQSSWLGFLFAVGGIVLWLILMLLYFSLFKYLWLVIGAPLFAFLSDKTFSILEGNEYTFNLNRYLIHIKKGVFTAIRNSLWQTVYVVSIIFLSVLPIIGWATPILAIMIECYYYGFSMVDYSCEGNKMNYTKASDFISHHKGLAIGNGIIFYLMHFVIFIGWIFAPSYAIIASAISMQELKSKETRLQ